MNDCSLEIPPQQHCHDLGVVRPFFNTLLIILACGWQETNELTLYQKHSCFAHRNKPLVSCTRVPNHQYHVHVSQTTSIMYTRPKPLVSCTRVTNHQYYIHASQTTSIMYTRPKPLVSCTRVTNHQYHGHASQTTSIMYTSQFGIGKYG